MGKKATGLLLLVLFSCLLYGCSIEKVRAGDGVKPEYTVMKEEDFPEKVKELIAQNQETEFQMTYQDAGYLYLLKGYGKQETRRIQHTDLRFIPVGKRHSFADCAYRPRDGEELKEEPSYPCLVVKMKYREEPVIFE